MKWILLLLFVTACTSQSTTTTFHGYAMTIYYKIIIGESLSEDQQQQISKVIADTFDRINNVYNNWNPDSEISRINQHLAHQPIPLSSEMASFLHQTDEIVKLTNGLFDPTIEPLRKLYKNHSPTPEEIEDISSAIGWDTLTIDQNSLIKSHDHTELDLGGIAKGYCIDLLTEELIKFGYKNLYVEWGGEIRSSGHHPEHRPWTIFISRLNDTNSNNGIAIVPLINESIATSGDYYQNWTHDGITYFHIIHPKALRPLISTPSSIASTTVIAPTCMLADALATTLMFFTPEEANVFAKQHDLKIWTQTRNPD